jgi:hypothetical protein
MAQRQAVFLGEPRQSFARAARKFDVGRERHRRQAVTSSRCAPESSQMRLKVAQTEAVLITGLTIGTVRTLILPAS